MASGPITAWQIEWEKVKVVINLLFLGSKITADGDCSHEIRRLLLLGRKVMTNLDRVLENRDTTLLTKVHRVRAMVFPRVLENGDTTLLTKVHRVRAMVFPGVMYGCESWTIKKAERQRIDAFEL